MAASQQASSINAQRESTLDHKLFRALRHGCTDKVREFARQNGNRILGRSQNGDTALHIAARFGHKILVMEILKYQPDLVSVQNHKSETPMHVAARAGNFGVAKIFMRPHGNGNNTGTFDDILRKQDEEGNTPLHNAVRKCDGKMAFTMIKKDPEPIRYINKAEQSPLSLAIDARLTHIACCMIKENLPALDHRGRNNLTLLHSAIIKSQFDVSRLISWPPGLLNAKMIRINSYILFSVKGDSFAIISSILVPCHQKAPLRFSKKNPSCCRIRILSSPPKYSLCCISSNI